MNIREQQEELESRILSPYAALSRGSKGRERPIEACSIRTEYQRDRDRILHAKSFRRLKHKTQVFISPEGDHYRTRLTHTLEVAQIARTISRALRLNEDLAEAIALGHDIGHTPFGHAGENALGSLLTEGFRHNEQSLRVVECLEGNGGLNLTWEVRDGIRYHTGDGLPSTLEGQIVRFSDRIAYINHDIDDALRSGVLTREQLPSDLVNILGHGHSERIDTMVKDMIATCMGKPEIKMSPVINQAMDELRSFLFAHVYIGSLAKKEEEKAIMVVKNIFWHLLKHPELLPIENQQLKAHDGLDRVVADFVAGMTDRYALRFYTDHFLPHPWVEMGQI
ncbi:MAG: deoxyguanosinetriphosphate triphosphohydrolase [Methylocystaceae bacterium]